MFDFAILPSETCVCPWQTGWLATVANLGDSEIIMQTTKECRVLSTSHRLNDNDAEIDRMERGESLPPKHTHIHTRSSCTHYHHLPLLTTRQLLCPGCCFAPIAEQADCTFDTLACAQPFGGYCF